MVFFKDIFIFEKIIFLYFNKEKEYQWKDNLKKVNQKKYAQKYIDKIIAFQKKKKKLINFNKNFSWTEQLSELEKQNITSKLLFEIQKPAFFLANVFQLFAKNILDLKNEKNLQKHFDLGFYLGFFLYLQYFKKQKRTKYRMKNFQLKKIFLNERSNVFLMAKMFTVLKCIENLKFLLPKKFNIFWINCLKLIKKIKV